MYLLQFWLCLFVFWTCKGDNTINNGQTTADIGRCNPYVDMIFVLDKSANITQNEFEIQKTFIHQLLKDHKAPRAAVRVAVMVCGDNYTIMSPFTEDLTSSSPVFQPDGNTFETFESDATRHCLENLNMQFKTKSRDAVARQAVILRGSWNWDLERSKSLVKAAKEDNTVIVVIAIGIQEFDSLSALRFLATGDATYFVLSKFQSLNDLAIVLAKDKCKPISLDLTSETRKVKPKSTTEKPVHREPCIKLDDRMFKRYIPGFGYTRLKCTKQQILNMTSCSCV